MNDATTTQLKDTANPAPLGLLGFGNFTGASATFKHATGCEGIVCGLAAIYTGLAQVLNELFGKIVLPLGAVKK
jgi:hypothetical protein